MRQQRLWGLAGWLLAAVASLSCAVSYAADEDDAAAVALYRARCADCHQGGAGRAPDRASLRLLPPGGVQWGSAADEEHVYVAVSDVRITPVPPDAPGGQPTPFGVNLRVDPEAGGGLLALKLATGEVVWKTPHPGCNGVPGCSPAQSAAVTAIPGVVFSGGLDGHLRAYAASGRIIRDVDTKRAYVTVNGVPVQGGSLDGPGPVVVDGMLYVSSGYGIFGGTPGNVLLAFSVDGK